MFASLIGFSPVPLTPSADASQLRVEVARLGRGTRRRVGRHRRRWRRIELCQDALEALDPWREDIALTVDRATHKRMISAYPSGARSGRGIDLNMATRRSEGESA